MPDATSRRTSDREGIKYIFCNDLLITLKYVHHVLFVLTVEAF